MLASDAMQYQHNITPHIIRKKLRPYRKDYLCFQTDGKMPGHHSVPNQDH